MEKKIYIDSVRRVLIGCENYTLCKKENLYSVKVICSSHSNLVYDSLIAYGFRVEVLSSNSFMVTW